MYAPTPTPEEIAGFQQRRSSARAQYLANTSQYDLNRGYADMNKGSALQKLGITFGRQRESLPGGFAQRGVLNSGIYQDALSRYGQDYGQAQGDVMKQYQQTVGQIGLDRVNNEGSYLGNVLGIENDDQARRAAVAAALRSVI